MKCLICGNEQFVCIHNGTRDVDNIDVMKCQKCGMVQLDNQEHNTEQNYLEGGMLTGAYVATEDKNKDMSWQIWIRETERDDNRRFTALKEICDGKRVLEFGCGNGGFLRRIRAVADKVTGIELMEEARKNIALEGIKVYKTPDEVGEKYDVICMFMVIEHLNNPDEVLKNMYSCLDENGILIIETVNAEDALISKYRCKAFEDFTYWSEHVFLYNSNTLVKLLERNGFLTKWNTQIQRYSLANHLYWLSNGKPGGHMKWVQFNECELNDRYAENLIKFGIADTLWWEGGKRAGDIYERNN